MGLIKIIQQTEIAPEVFNNKIKHLLVLCVLFL